ncbi:MAG: DUF5050 domain-containing protein [Gemmatimonadetes bacterium]|nr:DUF5050 domain-containing protein [Gemmatimonadota bacterium]
MIRSIASRRVIAAILTAAWSIFGAQSGYGQPVEEGKIYWTNPARGIHRSSLDGSNVEQLVIPDLRRPDKIALDIAGGKMYWTERDFDNLYRSNLDGSNTEALLERKYGAPGWSRITDIALDLDAGKIYWTAWYSHGDYFVDEYLRANLDGSDTESYSYDNNVSVDEWSIPLDVAGGKMYWTSSNQPYGIQRADLDGSNVENVITGPELIGDPTEIALDAAGGKLYWTNPDSDTNRSTIYRANLDGSDVETLMEREGIIDFALDLDQGRLYWTGARGTIQRASLDGTNVEDLFAPKVRWPYGMALDVGREKMYWSDPIVGSILRADLDGSGIEVLVSKLDEPRGIALIAESKIYWADSGTGKIQAAGLDGSPVEDIVTGLDRPNAIALDRGRSKIYWTNGGIIPYTRGPYTNGATIQRSNLDGSHIENIATMHYTSGYLSLDGGRSKIYWTNGNDSVYGTIQRSNLDGSYIENIVTDTDSFWSHFGAIALDLVGNQIYWGCWTTWPSHANAPIPYRSGIYRSNLDGSHVEHIPSGTLDGSRVENISSEPWGRGYLPAITSIALYIPHPTSVSTPNTTPAIPTTSGLDPNFPNPFNASTQIAYRLASPGPVRLEIYNVLGQPVRTLANQFQPAGFYKIPWDARDQRGAPLAAGVYLTHLRHPDGAQTRRLLYLK